MKTLVAPVLSLLLTFSTIFSSALAQSYCAEVFHSQRVSVARHAEAVFGGLRSVPRDANRIVLSRAQTQEYVGVGRRILTEAEEIWSKIVREESAALPESIDLLVRSHLANAVAMTNSVSSTRSRLTQEQASLYLHRVNVVVDRIALIDRADHSTRREQLSEVRLRAALIRESALEPVARGIIAPTDRDITIRDFNRLVGTGIFLIGYSAKWIEADGGPMNPGYLTFHDRAHTVLMPGVLSRSARDVWSSLLSWADQSTTQTGSLRHALLFHFSHETNFMRRQLERKELGEFSWTGGVTLEAEIAGLAKRLRKESFWEQDGLAEIPNLEARLLDEMRSLIRTYNHSVATARTRPGNSQGHTGWMADRWRNVQNMLKR